MEKTIEALKLCVQSESTDERINHMLQMLEKAEEQTKSLCDLALPLRNSQKGRGPLSPEMLEKCRAAGRAAGVKGKEAGIRGQEYGVLGGPSGALGGPLGGLLGGRNRYVF